MASFANTVSSPSSLQSLVHSPDTDPRTNDVSKFLDRLRDYTFECMRELRFGQMIALDNEFAFLEIQLDRLKGLRNGWDGYGALAPAPSVVSEARDILRKLQESLVKPHRISASAEGGIAFSFKASGDRRVQIEILNDGERFAHFYDLRGNSYTHEWPVDFQDKPFSELLEPLLHYMQP